MEIKHVHTLQLLEAKKAIEPNLYPLKTHVAHTLFGKKDFVSPVIATVEAKARILMTNYGLSADQVVDRVYQSLVMSLIQFVEGQRTLKSFLVYRINTILDRLMGSLGRKGPVGAQQPIRPYRVRDLDFREEGQEASFETFESGLGRFAGVAAGKPESSKSNPTTVILRKRRAEPKNSTYLDFYDDEF
jgi:hypothetical protein